MTPCMINVLLSNEKVNWVWLNKGMNPNSTKNTTKQKENHNNLGEKIPKRGPKSWLI